MYTGRGYTIDRWCVEYSNVPTATITIEDNVGVTINPNSEPVSGLDQKFENSKQLLGKTYTISIDAINIDSSLCIVIIGASNGSAATPYHNFAEFSGIQTTGITSYTFTIPETSDWDKEIRIRIASTSAFTLRRMKMEVGYVSTLANDPPMDYAHELQKCQRFYFQTPVIGAAASGISSGTRISISIPLPTTMRIIPTFSGTFDWARSCNVNITASTAISIYTSNFLPQGIVVFVDGNFESPKTYYVQLSNVTLDADL